MKDPKKVIKKHKKVIKEQKKVIQEQKMLLNDLFLLFDVSTNRFFQPFSAFFALKGVFEGLLASTKE